MFSSFRKPNSQGSSSEKEEEDPFTSILSTPALRVEFVLNIMLCTNHMREQLLANFDPSESGSSAGSKPPHCAKSRSGEPQEMPNDSEDAPPSYHTATSGRGRQDYDRHASELQKPETLEFRRGALASFNHWRTIILRKIGKTLNVRPETVVQAKEKRDLDKSLSSAPTFHTNATSSVNISSYYLSLETRLSSSLSESQRSILVSSLLLLLLSLESYSAYSRILLCHVATSLGLPTSALNEHELKAAAGLLTVAAQISAESQTRSAASANAPSRAWKVGLATVAGAALIGVTGGLAAPLLAAGIGGVFGAVGLGGTAAAGLLGALAGNGVLIGGLFGAYGGRMTGKMADKYAVEIKDFEFVPLRDASQPADSSSSSRSTGSEPPTPSAQLTDAFANGPPLSSPYDGSSRSYAEDSLSTPKPAYSLRVIISPISSSPFPSIPSLSLPFKALHTPFLEPYVLKWETSLLLTLDSSLSTLLSSYIWDAAASELVKHTLLATLAAGLWPLGLLRAARIIEHPFSVAMVRAEKAGKVLAMALEERVQGERPAVLVGYGLGAKVIFYACLELARRGVFGVVESICLMGAPVSGKSEEWRKVRGVVAGRVVNAYWEGDYLLGFLCRAMSAVGRGGVAGWKAVEGVKGVENWDVGEIVGGRGKGGESGYRGVVGKVLGCVGFEEVDRGVVEEVESAVRREEEQKKREWRKKKEEEALIDLSEEGEKPKKRKGDEWDEQEAKLLMDKEIEERIKQLQLEEEEETGKKEEDESPPPPLPSRPSQQLNDSLPPRPSSISPDFDPNKAQPSLSTPAADLPRSALSKQHQKPSYHGDPSADFRLHDESEDERPPARHAGIQMVDAESSLMLGSHKDNASKVKGVEAEKGREAGRKEAAVAEPSSARRGKKKEKEDEEKGGKKEMDMLAPEPIDDD